MGKFKDIDIDRQEAGHEISETRHVMYEISGLREIIKEAQAKIKLQAAEIDRLKGELQSDDQEHDNEENIYGAPV